MALLSSLRITNSYFSKIITKPMASQIIPDVQHRNMCQSQEDVILESTQNIGVIILNRPKYLNALNLSMVNKILAALAAWSETKAVIIMRGLGNKAFCAGGDVKKIAQSAKVGEYQVGDEFFFREYKMNNAIGRLSIPYVTLMDGITMGGGVGLAIHSNYRVATENTVFAMPETKIGFFPDVGASYFLPRMTGLLGLYLGLTGQQLKGPCVYHAGVASHYVESKMLPKLEQQLLTCSGHSDVKKVLDCFHKQTDVNKFVLKPHLQIIDNAFMEQTIEGIILKLKTNFPDDDWVNNVVATLGKVCPTSLKVAQRAYYRGMHQNLSQCLNMELQMAKHAIRQNNFYEGVSSVLISKNNQPKWTPPTLEEVTEDMIIPYFEDSTCSKMGRL